MREPATRRLAGEDVRAGVERASCVRVENKHGRARAYLDLIEAALPSSVP